MVDTQMNLGITKAWYLEDGKAIRKKILFFLSLVCFLGSVTGCGLKNMLFSDKLERHSETYWVKLDHQTNPATMIRACRNAVLDVSSYLQPSSMSPPDSISFSLLGDTAGLTNVYFGTGEEHNITIQCELRRSKKKEEKEDLIVITVLETGLPDSIKWPELKEKMNQMVLRVKRES